MNTSSWLKKGIEMRRVDLHMHSKYSDGSCTVAELLEMAEKENLSIISITDHDKLEAYDELKEMNSSAIFKGNILAGCECKCVYEHIPIEILGYGFDVSTFSQCFVLKKQDLKEIQTEYLERLKRVGKKIGLILNPELALNENIIYASDAMDREVKKYPENEEILKKNHIQIKTNFYRDCQSNKESIFYIDETQKFPKPEEVIAEIHKAGGLAFLAHPFIYPFPNKKEKIEKIVQNYQIDGLECYYSLFTQEEKDWIKNLAEKYHRFVSGGSDFHWISKPDIAIGSGKEDLVVDEAEVQEWISKLKFFK